MNRDNMEFFLLQNVAEATKSLNEKYTGSGTITFALGHNIMGGCEFVKFLVEYESGTGLRTLAMVNIYDSKPETMYVVELDASAYGLEFFARTCEVLRGLMATTPARSINYDKHCRDLVMGNIPSDAA